MRRLVTMIAVLCLVSGSACLGATIGDPASWNAFDLDFGTGKTTTLGQAFDTVVYGADPATVVSADDISLDWGAGNYSQRKEFSSGTEDFTYEFRLKASDGLFLELDMMSKHYAGNQRLAFTTSGTERLGSTYFTVDRTVWNTYRVVCEETVADTTVTMSLYLNNSGTAAVEYTVPYSFNSANLYRQIQGGLSTLDLDYIRGAYGAYVPVPEPMTLAVLALGGLAALLRRRR